MKDKMMEPEVKIDNGELATGGFYRAGGLISKIDLNG